MFGVSKVGVSMAGPGLCVGPGAATVLVEGMPCAVLGDKILPHGEPPHATSVIATNLSTTVRAQGIFISRDTSLATCMHPMKLGAATVKNSI